MGVHLVQRSEALLDAFLEGDVGGGGELLDGGLRGFGGGHGAAPQENWDGGRRLRRRTPSGSHPLVSCCTAAVKHFLCTAQCASIKLHRPFIRRRDNCARSILVYSPARVQDA